MKISNSWRNIGMIIAVLTFVSGPAVAAGTVTPRTQLQVAPMDAKEAVNRQFVPDWVRDTMENHHIELASKYMVNDYIQHHPDIDTGIEPYKKFFSDRPPTNPIPRKIHQLPVVSGARGDYVWFVWEGPARGVERSDHKITLVDWPGVVRFQGGKIKEHWDSPKRTANSPVVLHPGVSPRPPMQWNTGVLSTADKRTLAIANEALTLMHGRNPAAADHLIATDYIEHDPEGQQGRAGFKAYWPVAAARTPAAVSAGWTTAPVLTLVEGPYVLMMWDRTDRDPANPAKTYVWSQFELMRISGGMVKEHWDNVMPSM